MPQDTTTFVLAFGATFALLGWYMWRLERTASRLEATAKALATKPKSDAPPGKNP